MGHLFHAGDNLAGLAHLADIGKRVDLVYIDPPFATNSEFLMDSDRANTVSASGKLAYADTVLGDDYLHQLRVRLEAIRRVMAENGSIYLHIDDKMVHHVRLLMDEVFGPRNFRNSITRIKCNPKNFNRYSYGNIKDTILFYSVSPDRLKWNPQEEPLTESDVVSLYPFVDGTGRRYATTPLHAPGITRKGPTGGLWRGMPPPVGRHWRYPPDKLEELDNAGLIEWSRSGNPRKIIYADQSPGKLPQDVWVYKDPQRPAYPTQKNAAMLERIIRTSSKPGDTVLDCYAGSGSTLLETARLGRWFIGMDNSPLAQEVIYMRLKEEQMQAEPFPLLSSSDPTKRNSTILEKRGRRFSHRIRRNRLIHPDDHPKGKPTSRKAKYLRARPLTGVALRCEQLMSCQVTIRDKDKGNNKDIKRNATTSTAGL